MKRRIVTPGSLILVLLSFLQAKPPEPGCGTQRFRAQEERFLAERHQERRRKLGLDRRAELRRARDIGNLAVIDDSGGVVARRNPFSLNRKTVFFEPTSEEARRYRIRTAALEFDEGAASAGIPLEQPEDDGTQPVALPFAFPFYGVRYRQTFVNSDGNLTFTAGDPGALDRSFGRLAGALPRIAALFTDLDPSRSGAAIRVLREVDRVVITWLRVPLYTDFGFGVPQTFQVRLHSDGRIEVAYEAIDTPDAVVGISPGGDRAQASLITFAVGTEEEFEGTVGERFTFTEQIDLALAAKRFYETHDDAYDFLVFYNTLGIPAEVGAVAFEVTVRNRGTGFAEALVDNGGDYGSRRRLQAVANMGPLSQYPADPLGLVPARAISGDTPLSILAHEIGHRWLAYVSVPDPRDPGLLLGRGRAHWNFNFNSDASFLEGNRIVDLGEGRFTTTAAVQQYSALDQYLMGLRAPSEVAGSFVVAQSNVFAGRAPQAFVNLEGVRRPVSVDEVIAKQGLRRPDESMAQRRFRTGFVLVAANADPLPSDVAKLEAFRSQLGEYFRTAVSRRAEMETELKRSLSLSGFPGLGVIQGRTARFRVELESPAEAALTVRMEPSGDVMSSPPAAVIPVGGTAAEFEVFGVTPGTGDVIVRTDDTRYEKLRARVQVRTLDGLQLMVASGRWQLNGDSEPSPQRVVFAAADVNQTAFAGVPLRVEPIGGGHVEPLEAVTNGDGLASFLWTPAPGAGSRLRAFVDGYPQISAEALALARPEILKVVNGASFGLGVAPGGFATIFGAGLAAGREASSSAPFPIKLAGVEVLVNGRVAPLVYVSDGQVNIVIPSAVAPGGAAITVINEAGASPVGYAEVIPYAPGIFFDPASGFAAALLAGTGLTTAQRPVTAGDVIEIYCTGLGELVNGRTPALPRVRIGGVAAEVLYSGLSGGIEGLYQVNARLGAGTPAGTQELELEIGGVLSNRTKVAVF